MTILRLTSALAVAAALLTACSAPTTTVDRRLVVEGPADRVSSFVAAHTSETVAGTVAPLPAGRARATLVLADRFDDQDLLRATDRALAAGLSYAFTDQRTTGARA